MKKRIESISKNGWVSINKKPFFRRLEFTEENIKKAPEVNIDNVIIRDSILDELAITLPVRNSCCLEPDQEDIILSTIDRYGLPVNTVINIKSGLVRTDPYFEGESLNHFYKDYYRDLYTSPIQFSKTTFFKNQIEIGENIFNKVTNAIPNAKSVCEIGCGMGGILVPFKLNGYQVSGVDLGEEYITYGNKFNLNLQYGDIKDLIKQKKKFDLIILNHVIEHIPDLNGFMVQLKCVINKNGKLYIAVPGICSIEGSYNSNFLLYLQNAHCWHFSKNTLQTILEKNGFKILNIDNNINCLSEYTGISYKNIDLSYECEKTISLLKTFELQFSKQKNTSNKNNFGRRLMLKVARKVYQILK